VRVSPPPTPGVYFCGISRLYFTGILPASHRILGIPLYRCILYLYLYLDLAILQQIQNPDPLN